MRISDWSSDVCSSDLVQAHDLGGAQRSAALLGGDLDGTRSAAAMQVRAKLAGTSRTLHRCHHFAADHETTDRSEEHTSELQSLMRISYAVFCLKKKKKTTKNNHQHYIKQTTTHISSSHIQDNEVEYKH